MNHYGQVHDYKLLIKKWRALVRKNGWKIKKIAESADMPIYEVFSGKEDSGNLVYISAGIHGDEPASVWALYSWFEMQSESHDELSFMIFPCLNPFGLINNIRFDSDGDDLNRSWGSTEKSLISQIIERTKPFSFSMAINLHEDYDANGIYLYESLDGKMRDDLALQILSSGSKYIPVDSRKKIEGRWSKNGIIRPSPSSLPKEGLPEAAFLQRGKAKRTLVLETPSEYDLRQRIKAQVAMIQKASSEFSV
jgi:hypothetical protein